MTKVRDRNARIAVTRPNWRTPVGVEYSYRTSVFTSRDGTEQREAIRQAPRMVLKFTTALTRLGVARMHEDLTTGQAEQFLVRAEWLFVRTTADHVSPSTDFDLDQVPEWLVAGQQIIVQTADREDAYVVDSVAGSTVTVDAASAVDYPTGSKVYLAYWARAADQVQFNALTSRTWTGAMRFDVTPGSDVAYSGLPSGLAFHGRELFLAKPNWRENPRVIFTQDRDVFDPGMGRIDVFAPHDVDALRQTYGYTGLSPDRSEELVDFFKRRRGRRGSFWMPVWHDPIQPSDTVLAGDNTFRVDGDDFRTAFDGDEVYRTMVAFWPDGTIEINTISSIAGTTDSEITFAQDWSQPVTAATRVYWLARVRFESDTLDVRWPTPEVAELQYTIRTLKWSSVVAQGFSQSFLDLNTDGLLLLTGGNLVLTNNVPKQKGVMVDLYALGLTPEQITAGEVKVWSRYEGGYQEGDLLADVSTTYTMNITFHDSGDEEPVFWYSDTVAPVGGETTSYSGLQGPAVEVGLSPVTVPATARWVQFRVDYADVATSSTVDIAAEYAVSRTPVMSLSGTIYD